MTRLPTVGRSLASEACPCPEDNVCSGRGGRVMVCGLGGKRAFELARITAWDVNVNVDEFVWADSDSFGYVWRNPTRRMATGTFTGKVLCPETRAAEDCIITRIIEPGDIVSVSLWRDGHTTLPKYYWAFPCALIQSYTETVNVDTGDPIEFTATFGNHGPFYNPQQQKPLEYAGKLLGSLNPCRSALRDVQVFT